jgi:hypothetical protein
MNCASQSPMNAGMSAATLAHKSEGNSERNRFQLRHVDPILAI